MTDGVREAGKRIDGPEKGEKRIRFTMTVMRRKYPPLVKADLYMQRTGGGLGFQFEGIDPRLRLYHLTAVVTRAVGKKCIAAGMQDIEPAAGRSRDLPGRDAATAFSRRVQTNIYIIVLRLLLIIESQVADGAVLDIAFLHIHGVKVLISVYKPDVFQQLIEDPEFFGILFLTLGVLDKMNNEIRRGDAFFMLKEWELRMVAQLVSEQAGSLLKIEPEQRRALPAIIL